MTVERRLVQSKGGSAVHRREFLRGAAAAGGVTLARPALAAAPGARTLRFVPQANLTSLDPVWTTAAVSRNFGLLVYDTLYGIDATLTPRPQMAAGHVVEDDGRR
jgi:peptide/nickel transport system substrate-binding protein